MTQYRARVTGKSSSGGGHRGQASLYQLLLENGSILVGDYIEIAADGFRFLEVDEEVWCERDPERPDWASYIVPIRAVSPRDLLGLPESDQEEGDPLAALWL